MKFWLDVGVDGFRLDAVPYLVERDGTNCENLSETHAILRQLRKRLDSEYPGKMLLAEANQWPADVSAYFGNGDEFHMLELDSSQRRWNGVGGDAPKQLNSNEEVDFSLSPWSVLLYTSPPNSTV